MSKTRVIARIDIKNEFVIKGIQFDGLRKLGDPNQFAKRYYEQGIDEIVFMDAVASLYDRNNLSDIIQRACKEVFVPITVGGGIRTIADIETALDSGADKVAINTQAIKNPQFIEKASKIFGAQCIVGSIEAKKTASGWESYIDNGRDRTGKDILEWAHQLQELGAGEILLTSVDRDGVQKGFDNDLVEAVASKISIPLVVSGGAGAEDHIKQICKKTKFSGIAFGSVLHYDKLTIDNIKSIMAQENLRIRN